MGNLGVLVLGGEVMRFCVHAPFFFSFLFFFFPVFTPSYDLKPCSAGLLHVSNHPLKRRVVCLAATPVCLLHVSFLVLCRWSHVSLLFFSPTSGLGVLKVQVHFLPTIIITITISLTEMLTRL